LSSTKNNDMMSTQADFTKESMNCRHSTLQSPMPKWLVIDPTIW
jgi:hypothetical protein